MTARSSILDIPDEPPRQWHRVPVALAAAALTLLAGVAVARTFALGGWVRPWLAVEAVLAFPAMIVAWLLAGPHRNRTWLTVGVMIVALVLQPLAVVGATPSPAKLAQLVDNVGLPGMTVHESRVGNGRCRPVCSELHRTTIARGISYAKARGQLDGALRVHGFSVKTYGHRAGAPERIDATGPTMLGSFELRQISLGETRISQVWIARGPKSDYKVG